MDTRPPIVRILLVLAMGLSSCAKTTAPVEIEQPRQLRKEEPPKENQTASEGNQDLASKRKPSDTAGKPYDFTLTSEEIHEELKKDKEATAKKYQGKTILLSGTIWNFRTTGGTSYISLSTKDQQDEVRCRMNDDEPWAQVAPRQTVKIKGEWSMRQDDCCLTNCDIVEKGPATTITVTAEKLAGDYAKDPEGVKKKYGDKWLIVVGECTSKETDKNAKLALRVEKAYLKGSGKIVVDCGFSELEYFGLSKVNQGQRVKVFGTILDSECTADRIALCACKAITK